MLQTVKNSIHFLASLFATLWCRYPAKSLTVIGVTGTDGKTTTTELIYHILKEAGCSVSIISTIRAVIGNKEYDTGFHVTTPSPFALQKYFRKAKDSHDDFMVIEVTSHALDQYRTLGASIDIGVVLNVSHEHLDYHKTYNRYMASKAKIFKGVKYSVLNRDDKNFDFFRSKAEGKLVTFGVHNEADYTKISFPFNSPLLGEFNQYNILAAISVARILNISYEKIRSSIATFKGIVGRMEEIETHKNFRIFIDFAHKPNALQNALKTLRSMTANKLIIIFGCAGLRDKLKRPMMGKIASKLADYVVITAEDPRIEDVRDIIDQIAQGALSSGSKEADKLNPTNEYLNNGSKFFWRIPDRQEAINFAVKKLAREGDLILVAGKGHEKSMCYGKEEYPWDETAAIKKALND